MVVVVDSDSDSWSSPPDVLGLDVNYDSEFSATAPTNVSSLTPRLFNNRYFKFQDKLNFQSIGYYGREKEMTTILDAYQKVACQDSPSRLVIVHGQSGTGKSSLVQAISKQIHKRGILISGKFDQLRTNEPFSAVVAAFTDLCDIVHNDESSMIAMLGKEDARKLKNLVHNVYRVKDDDTNEKNIENNCNKSSHNDDVDDDDDVDDGVDRQEQGGAATGVSVRTKESLTECCCKFLRNVATEEHPIVLFLDDVQWADESSLDLMSALVNDTQSTNILLICAMRDEDDASQALQETLRKGSSCAHVIQLGNLPAACVNELLSDLLEMEQTETESLCRAVMQKTHGNPYFVEQFLEMLFADGHLTRNPDKSWYWDEQSVMAETNVSDNVVELVSGRIQRLEKDVQGVLTLAACLGFEFCVNVLTMLVKAEAQGGNALEFQNQQVDVVRILELALEAGLLEKKVEDMYKFSHDRVQQCLYGLIPEGEKRERLHLRMGVLLWELWNSPQSHTWMLFNSAEQMNRCHAMDEKEKLLATEVNLKAAIASKQKSAFEAAAEFLRTGKKLLGSNWSNYELQLQVCTMLAEIEYCMGNLNASQFLLDQIFENATCLMDKIPAYYTKIDCLGTEGKLQEAVDLGYTVIKLLGIRLPTEASPCKLIMEVLKTKRMLRKFSHDELLSLPLVKDKEKLALLNLVSLISTYAPLLNEEKQVTLLYLRVMQLSIKSGICCLTPQSFAFYGMVQGMLGNREEAFRFGKLCLCLIDRLGTKVSESRAISIIHCGLMHWRQPIQDSLAGLQQGATAARSVGDMKYVFFAQLTHLMISFNTGCPLEDMESRFQELCENDLFCKDTALLMLVRPYWQATLNLQESAEMDELTGAAMDEEEFVKQGTKTKNSGALFLVYLMKLQLAYSFGKLKVAEFALKKLAVEEKKALFHFNIYPYRLFAALTYYGLSHTEKQRRYYRRKARRHTRLLEKQMLEGNPNCEPLVMILRAEQHMTGVTGKTNHRGRLAYHEAVKACARAGLPHLEAFANERAWMACSERDVAQKEYLSRALQLYSIWGARSKLHWLAKNNTPRTEASSGRQTDTRRLESAFQEPAWCF